MKTLYTLMFLLALGLPAYSFAECSGEHGCSKEDCTCESDCTACKEGADCTCESCDCEGCKNK